MAKPDPTWSDIRRLIESHPKPPLSATVRRVTSGQSEILSVIHDGLGGWHVHQGPRTEISFGHNSTVIREPGRFAAIRDARAASNLWLKSLFQGRLMTELAAASGSFLRSESVGGVVCWVVDVDGLRRGEHPSRFRLWVEKTYGFIVRVEGSEAMVEVTDLCIGSVEGPTSS